MFRGYRQARVQRRSRHHQVYERRGRGNRNETAGFHGRSARKRGKVATASEILLRSCVLFLDYGFLFLTYYA